MRFLDTLTFLKTLSDCRAKTGYCVQDLLLTKLTRRLHVFETTLAPEETFKEVVYSPKELGLIIATSHPLKVRSRR